MQYNLKFAAAQSEALIHPDAPRAAHDSAPQLTQYGIRNTHRPPPANTGGHRRTSAASVLLLVTLFLALRLPATAAPFTPWPLTGNTIIHDPSTIIRQGTNYYLFGTGPGLRTKSSPDLTNWFVTGPVFQHFPVWTTQYVPDFHGTAWAPDIIRVHDQYYLYYAISTWGKQVSAIGLATSASLEPGAAQWTDRGPVITSTNQSAYNTIDPSVMLDTDGKLWMSFGSYWQGIFLTELNPETGLRVSSNSPIYHLAWNHSIEASCITRHGDYYYLFVNWGQCCQGTNSTYEVRLGRAEKITGPYLDRDGKSLADGGGSPFLQTSGRYIGPGHIGIVIGETNVFSYHYYDAQTAGRPHLAIGRLSWENDWPIPTN